MSEQNNKQDADLKPPFAEDTKALVAALNKHNKLALKRNRLAKRQHQQAILNYEQGERRYLLEKSYLQPTFRLSVTEFLSCAPDFMNDPEQASEAKFLVERGVGIDQSVIRMRVHVKGDAEYMRPSIVIPSAQSSLKDERVHSMTDLIYFATLDSIDIAQEDQTTMLYLVYRDKTTLPVVLKYKLARQLESALRRWDATHLDTVFVTSHRALSRLHSARACADFFADRE